MLPDDAGFAALEAAGAGLTSPELATLLAHTKLDLTAQVLATDLPDVAAFAARLPEYFPRPLRERFPPAIRRAPAAPGDRHHAAGQRDGRRRRDDLRVPARRGALRRPDRRRARLRRHHRGVRPARAVGASCGRRTIPTAVSDELVLESRRLLDRASRWFLTNRPQPLAVGAEIDPVRVHGARAARGSCRSCCAGGSWRPSRAGRGAAVGRGRAELRDAQRPCSSTATGCSTSSSSTELSERDREPRDARGGRRALLRAVRAPGHRPALTSVSALERGDRWHALARLALRDDLYGVAAGDHPRRAARGRPGHVGGGGDRAVGAGERVPAGARAGGAARGGHGRAARPGHAVGGVAAAARPGR